MDKSVFQKKEFKFLLLFTITILATIMILNIFSITSVGATSGDLTDPLKNFYHEYGRFVNLFIGFVVLSNILIFIYHFCRLGAVSTNPQERAKCLNDMFICGVCLGLIGGGAGTLYILFFIGN